MTTEMLLTLSVLAVTAALFMSGKVRPDLVAICALIVLILFNILTLDEALSGFANSIVIMMIGLFVVGGGIFRTGLAKMISGRLLKLAGTKEIPLFMTIMLASAGIGAFISNTGTVAVMLPIVVSMALSANISPRRLLMPLAFASSLGGTLTLIGTPPNLVIRETLINAGFEELSFFSFTPIGLVTVGLGTLLIFLLTKLLLPKEPKASRNDDQHGRSLTQLARQYQLSQNLFRVQVKEGSPIILKNLAELNIPQHHHVHIIEIRRRTSKSPFFKTINQETAGPESVIQMYDILYVYGAFEYVEKFAITNQLHLLDEQITEHSQQEDIQPYASQEIGIAEVLLPPNSALINKRVKHSGFREKFNVNILAIQRKGEYLLHQLKDERIRFGDALLIQGTWKEIDLLSQEQADMVVVGQPLETAASVTLDHKAPVAAGIMILMVILMVLDLFPATVSVLIAAVLMVITGCLRSMEEAYKTIDWESIVLIGGMIPMSIAIENTGMAALLSTKLVDSLGSFGPLALLAGIYFTTSMLTLFISNTASAVLFAPIALSAAVQLGVSPVPFMFAVAIAAGLCFAVPFSTPPNALVMSAGKYSFMDYVRLGLPLQILLGVVMVLLLPLFFPF